jgi:hypothetical protein
MVDRCLEKSTSSELPAPHTDTTFSNHGCSRLWLGSADERQCSIRNVDAQANSMALQSQGNVCDYSSHKALQVESSWVSRYSTIRQPNSGCLHSQGGRYTVKGPPQHDVPTARALRQMEHHNNSGIPSWQVQRYSGQAVQGTTGGRVASTSPSPEGSLSKVRSTSDRPVCERPNTGGEEVCLERYSGSFVTVLQRFQSPVAVPTGLGVPSTELNASGFASPKFGSGSLLGGSTNVEECILAAGPQATGPMQTHDNQEPTISADRSQHEPSPTTGTRYGIEHLEDCGWSDVTRDWTDAERALLKSSWRESTPRTYKPAWSRWIRWCTANNFHYKYPNATSVSRFLAFLYLEERLSYQTILLHKSVILTFGRPENNINLNSHFLVKHILKAISLRSPRAEKPPIWDPSELVAWLRDHLPTKESLFEASRRLACLLLLASGRRVHDLTLLRVYPSHYSEEGDSVILRPAFGSKTDTATYRQSGWMLLKHSNSVDVCPVFWLKKVIELGAQRRTAECDGALFISICGPAKAASRTVIGNWIKSLLREAGISASAGSIRSAVASLNWYENFPIEDILSRGNWRSENTFAKFYRREIIGKSHSQNNLSMNFKPL